MQQPPGLSQYSGSEQWRRALDVATELKATAETLTLTPEQEWLRYVLSEAADAIRGSVLWAATSIEVGEDPQSPSEAAAVASGGGDRTVTSLRQFVVAADATRGDALVASYFVAFAHSEGAIDEATARSIGAALDAIERQMDVTSRELTSRLGFDPYQDK